MIGCNKYCLYYISFKTFNFILVALAIMYFLFS